MDAPINCMHKVEFSKAISKLRMVLLKESEEFGQIKFISSRDIENNSCLIDNFVQTIKYNVFSYEIFSQNLPEIHMITDAKLYLLFLLNTDFSVRMQECFTLDPLNSHNMVGYLPTLSPYVFIQVIWQLNYERLLTHSLLQIPLDLCMEIIEITIRCINELNTTRAVDLLLNLCHKIYCKCLLFYHCALSSTVIESVTECRNRLVTNFQRIMNMLGKISHFFMLSNRKSYEQHGHILISIFSNLCKRTKIDIELEELKSYDVTFVNEFTYGRMKHCKELSNDEVTSIAKMLEQKMIDFLIKEMKKVDSKEFIGWAEIQYTKMNVDSMQHAIVITCRLIMKFMDDKFLPNNKHLRQCLQKFIDLGNSSEHTSTLQNLYHEIDNGKPDKMNELLICYKTWNLCTMRFVSKRIHLFDKEQTIHVLLKYLYHMFQYPNTDLRKYVAYLEVLRMMMLQQSIKEMYNTVYEYTVMYYLDNPMWYLYSQNQLEVFMASEGSIQDPKKLRILLIFILLNAEETLTTVFAIAIGNIKYEHINTLTIKDTFEILNKFFSIKIYKKFTILIVILKKILECNLKFNKKYFTDLLIMFLDNKVMTMDDLINQVYIPYLNGKHYLHNLCTILWQMEYFLETSKYKNCKINYTPLIITLIKMTSFMRKYSMSRTLSTRAKIIWYATHIAHVIFNMQDMLTQSNLMFAIQSQVEPIDKIYVMKIYKLDSNYFINIMKEYKVRCFTVYQQLRNARNDILMFNYAHSFRLDQEVFMRHALVRLTHKEFQTFTREAIKHWDYLGWPNQWDAFENILRIVAETAQIVLIFNSFPQDTFLLLMHKIIIISYNFVNTISTVNMEKIHSLLLKIMFSMKKVVSMTNYDKMYEFLLKDIKNISVDKYWVCKKYFLEISRLMNVYLIRSTNLMMNPKEDTILNYSDINDMYGRSYMELANMYRAYIFVCDCINMPVPMKIPIIQQKKAFHFNERIRENILKSLEYYQNFKMKSKYIQRYFDTDLLN